MRDTDSFAENASRSRSLPSFARAAVHATLVCLAASGIVSLAGCASHSAVQEEPVLTGAVTREDVEAAHPEWVARQVATEIDSEAALALAGVPAGAELTVYFGTWCGDSQREVPRFWRVLDETGSMVPFTVSYVAVDRDKTEPTGLVDGVDLLYVPTFVVRKDGEEIGRIVEVPEASVEEDLLTLFRGERQGILTSSRPELLEDGADG